jgi:hypothetical protein
MTASKIAESLSHELKEALALLEDYRQEDVGTDSEPLPSILDECLALSSEFQPPEPIRSFHQLACSGGTMISKCIAALPNVVLLSEIDPLSRMEVAKPGEKPRFAPSDVIHALNHATRKIEDSIRIAAFRASIDAVVTGLEKSGMRMVLRDHSHSQFFTDVDASARPTVLEILKQAFPTVSLISVRHPLDCFLGLSSNGWTHFKPFTLEEYSLRATQFLDFHDSCARLRYEDFVEDPQGQLERICDILALPFEPLAIDMIGAIRISGDSGRSSTTISARPRRAVPEEIEKQRASGAYVALCERLDYAP